MNKPKPFMTFSDMLIKLRNEKGLAIPDEEFAIRMLQNIGYYSLIGGYKEPFKDKSSKKYINGVSFEDIIDLYFFDERLRELILRYLLKIERKIQSLSAYYFTEKYGIGQNEYLTPSNYHSRSIKDQKDILELINKFSGLISKKGTHGYINYHINRYGNVPLWVAMNAITFGTLSHFYKHQIPAIQSKIAKHFAPVRPNELIKYLKTLTRFRNVCAHGERLYSFTTHFESIPDTNAHLALKIKKKGTLYAQGKNDLFSQVIAFKYLLDEDEYAAFFDSLNSLLCDYVKKSKILSENELLNMIGFPDNWKDIKDIDK